MAEEERLAKNVLLMLLEYKGRIALATTKLGVGHLVAELSQSMRRRIRLETSSWNTGYPCPQNSLVYNVL